MTGNKKIQTFCRAADLPDEWDAAASGKFFLRRESLRVLEETNPCGQRYHLSGSSIAVTYQHRLNLLTYGAGSLSLPAVIIGIPCSVSESGCCFSAETKDVMIRHLLTIKGIKIVLNTKGDELTGFKRETTLPTCRFENKWDCFNTYLIEMRSHYRHRIRKAQLQWRTVEASAVKPGTFGEELYRLYENVFTRSRYKLEKLSIEFFNCFPATITQFTADGKPIAFTQTVRHGSELIFMFAGMDYKSSCQYDTYLNILLHVIKTGIDSECSSIDMGQTAEEAKCKLGCTLEARFMHAAHSNRIGNAILQSLSGTLAYKQTDHKYHVFKQTQS